MWKLIEEGGVEAKFLRKTKSTEYFDQYPDPRKVESMTTYLKDVRDYFSILSALS
jgi:hypothetical protein